MNGEAEYYGENNEFFNAQPDSGLADEKLVGIQP